MPEDGGDVVRRLPGFAGAGRHLDVADLPQHLAPLQRAALRICDSREDAEDLVQETFEHVLRRPRILRGDDELAYLLGVLRNTHISRHRKRARQLALSVRDEDLERLEAVEADPSTHLGAHVAWATIATLPTAYRRTLIAVDLVGLSYREAAAALGVREGTVMSRLSRARRRVAEALEDAA